ncbi:hypothetical protein TNCV_208921 [Trichonephila clavipes]|uniref:Uncharacterized protein n=1 Tax=Trichonephila clavipes TaxID=2585209 RepID=A0A8X6SYC9_TRICX|nr:hypothetical protein TNCV_208921 [Trichonephila clavipes]
MRSACDQSTLPIDVQVFHCKARDPHVDAWRVGCHLSCPPRHSTEVPNHKVYERRVRYILSQLKAVTALSARCELSCHLSHATSFYSVLKFGELFNVFWNKIGEFRKQNRYYCMIFHMHYPDSRSDNMGYGEGGL